ncbi:MAG: MFS transporter [Desulfurococcales archaeon]|nr:MFS transporter [Desulfurococcales archaeon]
MDQDPMYRATMKKVIILGLLLGVSQGLIWSILAPYLRLLGYSGTQYGLVGSTAVLSGGLFTLVGGILSDKIGARKVVAIGLAVLSLGLYLVSSGDMILVAVGFFLSGIANGFIFTSEQALLARIGKDEVLHYTFSYVMAASTLGGAIGSFIGWTPVYISKTQGIELAELYRLSIIFAGVIPLLLVPLALSIKERGVKGQGKTKISIRGLPRRFYYIAMVNILIGFGAAMSIHNIDYYFVSKYGVTSQELGSVLGLQQLVMAYLMLHMPRLADKYGGVLRVYLIVSASSIPLLIGMTLTNNFIIAAGLYLVRSILMNVANPIFNAFVMKLVPEEKRGLASAFLSLSWTIPAGGGRAVGGYLLDINLELPLRLTALLYTIALTTLAYIFRDELYVSKPAQKQPKVPNIGITDT